LLSHLIAEAEFFVITCLLLVTKISNERFSLMKLLKLRFFKNLLQLGFISFLAGKTGASFGADLVKIKFCNDNETKLFMAAAYQAEVSSSIGAAGWWPIEPKSCSDLEFALTGDKLLIYANSAQKNLEWSGGAKICVDPQNKFDFPNVEVMDCIGENQQLRGFKNLSLTQMAAETADGQLQYTFSPDEAVRISDIVRLCNDSAEDLYVSMGQQNSAGGTLSVAGWFKIPAGECYETAKTKEADELLIFANTADGRQRWKGDVSLCTNAYDKFLYLEPKSMKCDGNNERLQRFKKVDMTLEGDFEYHLKPALSETVRSMAQFCNISEEKLAFATAYDNPDFPGQFVTGGWYGVDAGQCSEPLVVDSDSVYIYIENKDDDELTSGDFDLCVDTITAFEFSDGRGMTCNELTQEKRFFQKLMVDAGAVKINIP
jgi:uncharacterized membrane protein